MQIQTAFLPVLTHFILGFMDVSGVFLHFYRQ